MPKRSRSLIVVVAIVLMLGAATEEASSNRLSGFAIGVAADFLGQAIHLIGPTAPETPKTASSAKPPGGTGSPFGFDRPSGHTVADGTGEAAAAGLPANAWPDADLTDSGANGESGGQASGTSFVAANGSMQGRSPSAMRGGGRSAAFGSGPSAGGATGARSSFADGSPAQAAGLSDESLSSASRSTDATLPFADTAARGGVSPLVTSLLAELGQGLLISPLDLQSPGVASLDLQSLDRQSPDLHPVDLLSLERQPSDFQAPGFQPSVLQGASADGEWFSDAAFTASDLVTGGLSGELWTLGAIDVGTDWPPTFTLGVALDSLQSVLAGELSEPTDPMVVTPEPATLVLFGTGLLGVAYRFRYLRARPTRDVCAPHRRAS